MFSCEFSKTFITNSTAWSFLTSLLSIHIAIFSDSFIFEKATSSQFLRVTFFKVSQELLFRSSSFFRADAFFEELLFQNSHFFPAFFSQNIYLFRAKLLPRNQTLRTGNSLVQLPFRTATHKRHLQKSYFFEAYIFFCTTSTFSKESKILKKVTFPEKQNSALPTFSGELPF